MFVAYIFELLKHAIGALVLYMVVHWSVVTCITKNSDFSYCIHPMISKGLFSEGCGSNGNGCDIKLFGCQLIRFRGRPFDSWGGGGLWFLVKKKIVQQIFENK